MSKIKITESQLKKLRSNINENLDMPDNPMNIPVKEIFISHLKSIKEITDNQEIIDRLEFLELLVTKYPDTNKKITTNEMDSIYDEMLGEPKPDKKDIKIDKNPFPGGYDFSLNESIRTNFNRFL
jgi:hypothetical protein